MMAKFIKLGRTSFNVDEVKKLSFEQFKGIFKGKLHGVDISEAYEKLTGKKAVSKPERKPSRKDK